MLDDESNDSTTPTTTETPDKPVRRRRATKAAAAPAPAPEPTPLTATPVTDALTASAASAGEAGEAGEAPEAAPKKAAKKAPAKAPAKKAAPRKRATKAAAAPTPIADVVADEDDFTVDTASEADTEALADAVLEANDGPKLGTSVFVAPAEPEEAPTARRRSRAPAVVVTFQAPEAGAAAPARPRKATAALPAVETGEAAPDGAARRRRRAGTAGVINPNELLTAEDDTELTEAQLAEGAEESEGEDDGTGPRRRRRGRRGRGRRPEGEAVEGEETEDAEAGATAESSEASESAEDESEDEDGEEGAEGTAASTRRRRRRRRTTGAGAGTEDNEDDVPTVVHVREPGSRDGGNREPRQRAPRNRDGGNAADEDGVRGISGSTRMAAKRVRRQEGRDSGRKRAPIVSEAEFLARREAVDRQMVVRQKGDRTQIAVLEDGILVEHYVTKASASSYAGNVYLGRVQNVLPSMEAAFVDIGKGRNAVLYAGEVNWDGVGSGSRKIEQALKSGQEVLVQVSKDPMGHKGARLTSQISLPGRYLVYVPESSMTGISRKLPENERTRLKNILKNVVPEGAGVIIRTAAEGASEEEIGKDVRRLQAQWEVIKGKAEAGGAPKLLHAEPDLVIKVVRDVFNEDFTKLVVQGESEWQTIKDYVEFVAPDLAPRLSKHAGNGDVFAEARIDEQLLKALDRKVYLPSGGSLVIDRTEAMIVVDVNTGKYVGKGGNLEETVTRNNLEAAEEIARQLRLRDLGGIIVVDFIDMVLESNRDLVVRRLVECLGRDRTKHQVAEVTSLGLVQMTRKRVGQGLLESFSETCEHCNGRGVKIHMDPIEERPQRDRDRLPKVGPRAPKIPKPGPQLDGEVAETDEAATPAAGEGTGGGSRNRRRRGGRGQGSAGSVSAADELVELLTVDEPVELEADTDVPALSELLAAEEAVALADAASDLPAVTPELDELVSEEAAALADGFEGAPEGALAASPEGVTPETDEPAVPVIAAPVVEDLPPAPKKRRRAVSRPAGAP